jgi:NAD(P)-dependent dehydrogenase (short-subunit alcohol dehydrogenase family)
MGMLSLTWLYSQLILTPPCPTRSFAGECIIVTGSNVGLGHEAARHFVRLGAAKVILAVRNQQAGEEAKRYIELSTKSPGTCEVWQLDLASYDSVISIARRAKNCPDSTW